jgi:hypothetical protein
VASPSQLCGAREYYLVHFSLSFIFVRLPLCNKYIYDIYDIYLYALCYYMYCLLWRIYEMHPDLSLKSGCDTEATETAPISEVMRQLGLVMPEGAFDESAPATEAEQVDVEEGEIDEDDYSVLPSKPSHLEFGKSTVTEDDMPMLIKLGYFSEAKKKLVRFGREEITPKPEKDEVVVFRSFFKAGLRFPLHEMIADVLENFRIYLHQLTPNAIVRLSVYIWALRSQGQNRLPKASAKYMSFTIRQKLEKMSYTRTSAATILVIAKMQNLRLLATVPNVQPAGRLSGFMLRLMRKRRSWFRVHWS